MSFPAPIITPHFDPPSGFFNMTRAVNRDDVDTLSSRSTPRMGHLLLSHPSPVSSCDCQSHGRKEITMKLMESLRSELLEVRSQARVFKKRSKEGEIGPEEIEGKFQQEIAIL
ncbi:UNVERIFIED_CONTAM: hypothetical protein Sindi_0161600 [Sesamum indicum]